MQLYNSLTKQKEVFKPFHDKKVKMYVCGITPYDTTHLGHAFVYVTFDTLKRYLEFKGYQVEYTQNVTDIDDDIIKRAKKEKRDWQELGQEWTEKFLSDLKQLNVEKPTHYTKATDHIATMIRIIETLIDKKFAYQKNGNIYFDISSFPQYGQLSHFKHQQMIHLSSERGANPDDPNKKHPLDFLLWQKTTEGDIDEHFKTIPSWDSPWGKGRPGWHIECSAMSLGTLGEQIDIHGGGKDLVFPHHESEIAQSESYTDKKPFTKTWMHIAMLMYQGEKMSKSLGNLVLVSDLLKTYSANTIRWLLLSQKYRNPWEFREEQLDEVAQQSEEMFKLIEGDIQEVINPHEDEIINDIFEALEDDFNTQFALIKILAYSFSPEPPLAQIKYCLKTLGFDVSK